ncbi:MAG: exo-beta-N-acetylmuramidase NamZ domain-containing protein [Muribaculaceae bacterium]
MKKFLIAIFAGLLAVGAAAQTVKPGIEVLRDQNFAPLQGKRVGLITNPTGIDNNLRSTIDILYSAPGVQLVGLYAPEHGVRGDVHAGDHVDNFVDPATGVTVYSCYGATRKPTAEMLKDVDVLIYDIQDIGCRSYTFISTMGVAMEACAELGKQFMVLDRPNPVGGNKIEGCLAEDSCISFVSQFPIPYLYGLTPGELAMYLNEEGLLANGVHVDLTVIPMEGWTRDMDFRQTGMPWVLPSPHIPNPEAAVLYPVTGILGEIEYMNIGVGYTEPFKLFCAEWCNAEELASALNDLHLPGILFRPIHIKPFYSFGKDENLQGVEVYITDRHAANLSLTQFYVMQEIARLYPDHKAMETCNPKRFSMFDKVCGSFEIRRRFSVNHSVADIIDYWNKDVEAFRQASSKYYLYQ